MAKEYIEREAAVMTAMDYDGNGNAQDASQDIASALMAITAADVALVTETNEAVDEALRILDAINSSGCITYNTYCELHNAICDIYQDCLQKNN